MYLFCIVFVHDATPSSHITLSLNVALSLAVIIMSLTDTWSAPHVNRRRSFRVTDERAHHHTSPTATKTWDLRSQDLVTPSTCFNLGISIRFKTLKINDIIEMLCGDLVCAVRLEEVQVACP